MAWLCFYSCFSFFFFNWWLFIFLVGLIPAFHTIPHHTHCGYSIVTTVLAVYNARLCRAIKGRNPNYVGLRQATIVLAMFFTLNGARTMRIMVNGSLLAWLSGDLTGNCVADRDLGGLDRGVAVLVGWGLAALVVLAVRDLADRDVAGRDLAHRYLADRDLAGRGLAVLADRDLAGLPWSLNRYPMPSQLGLQKLDAILLVFVSA